MRRLLVLVALGSLTACGPVAPQVAPGALMPSPIVRQQSVAGIRAAMVVMAKRQFDRQDKNRDGWIDRFKEWEGWDDHFLMGDTNRDNKLTLVEYEALMTGSVSIGTFQSIAYRQFRDVDTDKDRQISAKEWQAYDKRFSDGKRLQHLPWQPFDRNGDGQLNQDEYEDAFAHYWSRHSD